MAVIKSFKTKEEIEIPDGSPINSACKKLGVPFGCETGICGTCMINIVEGENNLSELTNEEKALKRDSKHRLACQCKINSGEITINF